MRSPNYYLEVSALATLETAAYPIRTEGSKPDTRGNVTAVVQSLAEHIPDLSTETAMWVDLTARIEAIHLGRSVRRDPTVPTAETKTQNYQLDDGALAEIEQIRIGCKASATSVVQALAEFVPRIQHETPELWASILTRAQGIHDARTRRPHLRDIVRTPRVAES